ESVRDFFGCTAAHLLGQIGEGTTHGGGVQREILRWTENLREEIRDKLADQHIGVGDGERYVAPVALRTWASAGGNRPDAETDSNEVQTRAAIRRHLAIQLHRSELTHACGFGLKGAFVHTIEMGHIGRCPANVEANKAVEPSLPSGFRHSNDAAGGSGKNRVF